ncbi:FMN-binding negative transcriptional regulator [Hephaestia sp. GCM10023244]|uniref:FMN-binding negative transcriptional regulator n=1 Tax=unclassified Hephaestia TaxID=2631281 RepID=UPI00207712D9|nr:FMN-binding negative transcriptional regulator [Hephaestia sp. MAHUQ-44]MCM8729661.1 FMN-binding negative transcriptional regulator [Hephaestia sp. MAHUQ-44]
MHPNGSFRWEDRAAMRALVEQVAFGALFAATPDGPRVAHLPVTWDGDDLTFHLARGNALTRHLDGATGLFVINGPDAYVSPDHYGLDTDQVPTWNYVAVELEGRVSPLDRDGLIAQLDALALAHEARLAPKPAWSRDKMERAAFEALLRGIKGFRLRIQAWRGTIKLNQNKPESARLAAADALDAQGRRAIAHWMRQL